jgi:hypothetical protein
MCILDLEESEVTNDGTQALWEMIRTAVVRGLTASWNGSFLIFGEMKTPDTMFCIVSGVYRYFC